MDSIFQTGEGGGARAILSIFKAIFLYCTGWLWLTKILSSVPPLLRASPPAPPLFLSFSTLCLIEAVPPCGTSSPRGWTWPAVPQPHPLRSGWTLPSISPLPLGVEAFQEHLSDPTFPLCRLIGHPVASSASSTEKPSPRSPLTSSSYSCAGT